ncbi:MAG: DUF2878 family protein [Candidatus Omnitrophica bacterium]|nr:DUF2878 family protein [Candidatus Omnitrophota bacterium]
MNKIEGQKLKILIGFVLTLLIIHFVPHDIVLSPAILLVFWTILFWPWHTSERIMFAIAAVFFFAQNYSVLAMGGFTFKHQDFFLMPSYEPFLWGFYFLSLKRFIDDPAPLPRVEKKAIFGLILTAACFSIFANNSTLLLYGTVVSTGILFYMFHQRYDLQYALTALGLGFIVEIFGVQTGLWTYPKPDMLGIPFWFATMWCSVGLLGRRFLIPLAISIINKFDKTDKS